MAQGEKRHLPGLSSALTKEQEDLFDPDSKIGIHNSGKLTSYQGKIKFNRYGTADNV